MGVRWSNFRATHTILQAKFSIGCSLSIDITVSLLKPRPLKTVTRVLSSEAHLTRFICPRQGMQEETALMMCSLWSRPDPLLCEQVFLYQQ